MKRRLLCIPLLLIAGCRLNPDCFRSDECNPGFVCVDRVCVDQTAQPDASDASEDAAVADRLVPDEGVTDALPTDRGVDDAGVADMNEGDAAGADQGPSDTGHTIGPHAQPECKGPGIEGHPLPDGYSVLQPGLTDLFLLHFDDPDLTINSSGYAAVSASCSGACAQSQQACEVYNRALDLGSQLQFNFNVVTGLQVAQTLHHLEAWVRWNGNPGCITQARSTAANQIYPWSVCIDANGFLHPEESHTVVVAATSSLSVGQWQHIDMFYDDADAYAWIDGEPVGGQFRTASPALLEISSFTVSSTIAEIDELRLAQVLTGVYPTSYSNPRVCLAFKDDTDQLYVADESVRQLHRLRSRGQFPRLSPDLTRVVFTQCNGTCNLMHEEVATGVVTMLEQNVSATVGGAIDVANHYLYVPAATPNVLVRVNPMNRQTTMVDASSAITAFDVGLANDTNGLPVPTAFFATVVNNVPQIQLVEYPNSTTFIVGPSLVYQGDNGAVVQGLHLLGVGVNGSVFSTDLEGHWLATVRQGGGSLQNVAGNRNGCAPCTGIDASPRVDAVFQPNRYIFGLDSQGNLHIIDNISSHQLTFGDPGYSQLDLQWRFDP